MKTSIILAAVAGFASSVSAASGQYFGLIATYSASPIHLRPITASGTRLWIGKQTQSYCPASVRRMGGCPPGKYTNFIGGDGTLSMGVAVPGGQQVYIDRETGALHYTVAHSADTHGGITGGWSKTPQPGQDYSIVKHKGGLVACPTNKADQYQIFANLPGLDFSPGCIGPFNTIGAPEKKPDAWQYT